MIILTVITEHRNFLEYLYILNNKFFSKLPIFFCFENVMIDIHAWL
jgi:hypothetical protein